MKGLIFDIQRFSLHDGDGIRTVVFFKGCSLHCPWCCNPESLSPAVQVLFNPSRCIDCGLCGGPEKLAGKDGARHEAALATCPTAALTASGRWLTVADVMDELAADEAYYNASGGGVTLSGGEVLQQAEFAEALLSRCQARGYHTAIETSGYGSPTALAQVAQLADQVLFDIKTLDRGRYREVLGGDGKVVLDNLRALSAWHPSIVLRYILVPGFNMADSDYANLSDLMQELSLGELHLLPLHHLGGGKYARLAREYHGSQYKSPTAKAVTKAVQLFQSQGLNVLIGG